MADYIDIPDPNVASIVDGVVKAGSKRSFVIKAEADHEDFDEGKEATIRAISTNANADAKGIRMTIVRI